MCEVRHAKLKIFLLDWKLLSSSEMLVSLTYFSIFSAFYATESRLRAESVRQPKLYELNCCNIVSERIARDLRAEDG